MKKKCKKCGMTKLDFEFSIRRDNKDGLNNSCRECISKMMGQLYRNNPQHYLDKTKKKENELREIINKIKSERGCPFCNEREPVALDFHHIDPLVKDKGISELIKLKSKKRLLLEIEKCVVICANHHRKLEANLISLP